MFKKPAAALLALIMLLSFFACDTPGANGGEDSIPSQSPTLLPSAADTAQPTPTDSAIEYKKFSTKPFSRAATVSRAVLHDDDRISISANELTEQAGFSANILTRLRRDQYVSLESIEKLCFALDCGVDDILEFIPDEKENGNND